MKDKSIQKKGVSQHKSASFFNKSGGGGFFSPVTQRKSFFGAAPVVQNKKQAEDETKQLKSTDQQAPVSQQKSSSGSGGGLPDATKAKMESSFGTDLSHIKVHTNSESAENVGALAYAQGNDLHFAKGQFNPGTDKGDSIIGHEVAHTFQQAAGEVKPTTKVNGMDVNDNPGLEKQADDMGAKAAKGEPISMKSAYKTGTNASGTSQRKQAIQRLTLYAHGFLLNRDLLGNKKRRKQGEVVHKDDYNGYWGNIDDMFEARLHGKDKKEEEAPAQEDAQNDKLNDKGFALSFGEGNVRYFDGSANPLSKAKSRMKYGREAARNVHEKVLKGDITLQKNAQGEVTEPIVLVGHSMGAAYAAGMATQLLEFNKEAGKTLYPVKAVYYLAPHQPKDIVHPQGVRGVQHSHERDAVSSKGILPFLTGSKLGKIQNVSEYVVHEKKVKNEKTGEEELIGRSLLGGRGGHNVGDHDYIFSEFGRDDDGYVTPHSESEQGQGAQAEQSEKKKGLLARLLGRRRRRRRRR